MKRIISLLLSIAMLLCMVGCGCDHEWMAATCIAPKTCTKCGEAEGEALGHKSGEWTVTVDATFAELGSKAMSCSQCGEILEEEQFELEVYEDGVYLFSANEFVARIERIMGEENVGLQAKVSATSAGDTTAIIYEDTSVSVLFYFLDSYGNTISTNNDDALNASAVMAVIATDDAEMNDILLPIVIKACNNSMSISDAGAIVSEVQSTNECKSDEVSYFWTTVQGYDTLYIGFDAVPNDSSNTANTTDEHSNIGINGIRYDENGMKRSAAEFANEYGYQTCLLYYEYKSELVFCEELNGQSDSYAIHIQGDDGNTMMTFANNGDALPADGSFDQIMLTATVSTDAEMQEFAFYTSALMYLIDSTIGELTDCVSIVGNLSSQSSNGVTVEEEINGITYKFAYTVITNGLLMVMFSVCF